MTTPSKPIVSESDSAKIEESEEHTTGQKFAVQDMQEDKIQYVHLFPYKIILCLLIFTQMI